MEMEKLESTLFNWPLAPYDNKLEVDANYKRMVTYGMEPKNIQAVNLGIASHNLFELAYASVLAGTNNVKEYFYFEMLEGMADHVRRALQESSGDVLLYAPVASKDEFINAIAYLIRRLDENTAPENFLRYSADLEVGSKEWNFLRDTFVHSRESQEIAQDFPNRIQNRLTESFSPSISTYESKIFINEPDTDWALESSREWAESIRARWMRTNDAAPLKVPIVIAGEEIFSDRERKKTFDPNRYGEKICVASCALATAEDAKCAVQTARSDPDGWRNMSVRERHEVLSCVAMELRKARGTLIGTAAADTGKIFTEADVEVSEAIDFAEFYPYTVAQYEKIETLKLNGKGVGLVISPWNFPIAIPCGGIVASLAAGNTVIFKPASDSILTAWELCKCFWRAGVTKNSLQFVPCSGSSVGPVLTTSPDVDYIILTGGTDTGLSILQETPGVYLAAETGGKNATIVTDMADRDQAIKNVIQSAFSNCGQKCSATSLLILEKTIYDDGHFKEQLVDAAESLKIGSAWEFSNKLGPLVKPPTGDLQRGLTSLEEGEEWVLKSEIADNNPSLWSPGIKYGVKQGGYTHLTEFFGPLLGVMRADNLDHALVMVNQTGYGLTSGIESLDHREQDLWKERVFAGNLYINRGTTGAIVLRQPFGGLGKSALGPGLKAGSPEYVTQFMNFKETGSPETGPVQNDHYLLQKVQEWKKLIQWNRFKDEKEDIKKIINAIPNYLYQIEKKFCRELDFFHLRGQDNILRFLPIKNMVIRLHPDDSLFNLLGRSAAAIISGCEPRISIPTGLENNVTHFLTTHYGREFLGTVPIMQQTDDELVADMANVGRIRYGAPDRVPAGVSEVAAQTGFYISRTPVYMDGQIELLQYFQQQSICNNYHRYGNLGERAVE